MSYTIAVTIQKTEDPVEDSIRLSKLSQQMSFHIQLLMGKFYSSIYQHMFGELDQREYLKIGGAAGNTVSFEISPDTMISR